MVEEITARKAAQEASHRQLERLAAFLAIDLSISSSLDVRVTLEVWPGMIHAFPLWNAQLADARAAIARAGTFIGVHA